jgi:fascin 1/2
MGDGAGEGFNPKLKWKMGLIASNGKYLTMDQFGTKVHATGPNLGKKQVFTIDPYSEYVYIIGPTGKYLSAGQKGELECAKMEPGKEEEWTIEALDDGKWAIKSSFGYYLAHKGEQEVHSFNRGYTKDTEKINSPESATWTVHLAIHPQVVIRNNNRSSYVHLEGNNLNCNEAIAWGVDATVTIGYHDGKYSLRACDGRYLNSKGDLTDDLGDDNKFILVVKEGEVAFKTNKGKYLQSSGSTGKMHAKQNEITKNELYQFEDSYPQVTLQQGKNFVTWKQGTEVKCVHDALVTDKEIFQMEIDRDFGGIGGKWSFRNNMGGYLTLNDGMFFTGEKQERNADSWFTMEWHGDSVSMKASNGKYLQRLPNGNIKANSEDASDATKFLFGLINRPLIVLRSEFGFLGVRQVQGKPLVQCNFPIGEVFKMEHNKGQYALKAGSEYLKLESDGSISVTGSSPEWFYISLPVHTKLALKAAATLKYVKAEQSGIWKASSNSASSENELLEY